MDGKFYSPLLDDAGLTGISTIGQTPNMLVYAPAEASTDGYANKQTYDVLTESFAQEPIYSTYDTDHGTSYRRVASAVAHWGTVLGHLVQSNLTATNDHLLVDKENFNCPIAYQFDATHRMWYQRMPDRYVSVTKGWETVSLPFTAELVTTQDKGEITHFYSGSRTIEGSDAKIGHEYWLREFKGITVPSTTPAVATATFNYPDAAAGDTKNANNTFLWDYYYSANNQADANADTYQTYYKENRELSQYPLLANGTPYIVGFPGTTYREFDLSGAWVAPHTAATTPAKLDKQVITFASTTNIGIGVSDDELNGVAPNSCDYTFMPNYMDNTLKAYHMNTDGNRFEKGMDTSTETPTEVAVKTVPFRPYFIKTPTSSPAPRRAEAQYIVFDSSESSFAIGDDPSDELAGELTFSTKPRKLITTSSLRHATDVRIFSTSGQSIASFTIQPGETVETDINIAGVYIVRADNGRYTKKIALR